MLGKFLPKQNNFFLFFSQAADKLVLASQEFKSLVNDLPHAQIHAKKINDIEHEGDAVALLSYQLLHKTFITPFDRNDIHALTTQLDDTLDHINRLSQRFVIYHFTAVPAAMGKLAEFCLAVTERVRDVVGKLESLKNLPEIAQICFDIDQLENEAEAALLDGVSLLFDTEDNIKELLKLKEVYEQIKLIINNCQDTANLVKSIVLEYA